MEPVEADLAAGLWVPTYFGNRFKLSRLKRDRRRTEQNSTEVFATLAEAQCEADRRNHRVK